MANCTFCKIVKGQSPSQMLYQDERVSAFRDIHPVAPTHVLIVPNKHIERAQDMTAEMIARHATRPRTKVAVHC